MKTIGCIRISIDKQDTQKQGHFLLKYTQQNELHIDRFINFEMSSRKSTREHRIDELLNELAAGDTFVAADLSRLGRNKYEVIEIINRLGQKSAKIVFVRQPEQSTTGPQRKLLQVIYSYFAEAKPELILLPTKQGLAVARAIGKPDKHRVLDPVTWLLRNIFRCVCLFGETKTSLTLNWQNH